jgi:hypothetical protein
VVESGARGYHAIGTMKVIRAAADAGPGPTATSTSGSTPTPVSSPVTDGTLGPGDTAPVSIWTMHSFRNMGDEPAVILDIRIAAGGVPDYPADLDGETLAPLEVVVGLQIILAFAIGGGGDGPAVP